jgi:hypothetical protein
MAETLIAHMEKRGFRYELAGCSPTSDASGEWSVVFDVFMPSGSLIDGPVVGCVDERSRKAHLVEGP